ncbi:MAG: fibrobacter succinogenes major paralogous domain-containing protein, partial [Bacteroidota bacterium]
QVWMNRNLNVSTFRNGDLIPEAKTKEEWEKAGKEGKPAWCYYNNDSKNDTKYGKLYNWFAVNDSRGLAPQGYHVPSDDEWTTLSDYLGGTDAAGTKMKSISGWEENGNGTNESGFSGLPGGYRTSYGSFRIIGQEGRWWSSTENEANIAWAHYLNYDYVYSNLDYKRFGYSVRCLRD